MAKTGWVLPVVLLGIGVGVGWALRPQPDVGAAVAQAKREAGDSATAAVSRRYLAELVTPLRDSIAFYRARPVAGTRIVVQRDTVWDTTTVLVTAATRDSVVVRFPVAVRHGVAVAESLVVRPAPVDSTTLTRYLSVAIMPDTVLAALLQLDDGSQRFTAVLQGYGWARVADAAVAPARPSRWGLGCTAGPAAVLTLGGQAYGGLGATCGIQIRF